MGQFTGQSDRTVKVLDECKLLGGCKTGEVKITNGHLFRTEGKPGVE